MDLPMRPPLYTCAPLALLLACTASAGQDPCDVGGGLGATSDCLSPKQTEQYYVDQSDQYFDTLESDFSGDGAPNYAEGVARWEWPPWLKLTGYGKEDMESADALIRLIPTSVPVRDCRFFEQEPFGRCRVSFAYDDYPDQLCPIYEEFTFDDAGEMTFIEAWSDNADYLPDASEADAFDAAAEVQRLSSRLPGLGGPDGVIDLHAEWMDAAAAEDADVADFVERAGDFYANWLAEYEAAGPDVFALGCGFPMP